jgi:malate synthase
LSLACGRQFEGWARFYLPTGAAEKNSEFTGRNTGTSELVGSLKTRGREAMGTKSGLGTARSLNNSDSRQELFDASTVISRGFLQFLLPLHEEFSPRQQALAAKRESVLEMAHRGVMPNHLPASEAVTGEWRIELAHWCRDQRNQMTGPADDVELAVKMLNSGAPGVMLDLEDSMVNEWSHVVTGIQNILEALRGKICYFDEKRNQRVGTGSAKTVLWVRPRGLHLSQAGVLPNRVEKVSASLFDMAAIVYGIDPDELSHPLSFYIPKSESAQEALWWRDVFRALARAKGLEQDYIKCMALVESHPLAYQMEEFAYNLRDHLLGLNLGRWDYMASLIHFNLPDPKWVLPDRNTIPHNVSFFQRLRDLMVEICHKRGMLAIGGMTALYPSRTDKALNERALKVLAEDKKNEADCLMDGAWTGHPDQNEIAVGCFPYPNQGFARKTGAERYPDLRPSVEGIGRITLDGVREAVRTVVRYRNGVLHGKGASLLDGYMEDLATDRIYRLMIAQRTLHASKLNLEDGPKGRVELTAQLVTSLFDQELERLVSEMGPGSDPEETQKLRQARRLSEQMIVGKKFNPE